MPSPALLPHLSAARAQLTQSTPALCLTFGDVPSEYAAAREGAALFDATDRESLLVTGADARDFLQRLLANRVTELAPGQGNRTLLLSATGKVLADLDLAVIDEQAFELSGAAGTIAPLAQTLDRYLFSEDVTLTDSSAEHTPLELCGPAAHGILAELCGPAVALPAEQHASISLVEPVGLTGQIRVTRLAIAGQPGWRLACGPDEVGNLWQRLTALGAAPAGFIARESLRVEAGQGLWGTDISDAVYPQEACLEDAFSLAKGCYTGQEVVAKIDAHEDLNKRLTLMTCDHDDPVPAGTRLYRQTAARRSPEGNGESGEPDAWRDLGVVTTWAYSFAFGCGAVLAYVKRGHQEPGTRFRLGAGPQSVTVEPVAAVPG
ncbi:MAG: hypothetical protein CMK00_09380 [Planctomycetes bacterium]|jgi:folate-binding protein YgfZ|nr:hypothetical protein [Planctomycetota bacterium]HJO26040.1 glycine cleavage T C-terminal barrel domain-containing protein [Planctomycetota bacterium]